jgi:DNA-binding SARP family transcriptional activator
MRERMRSRFIHLMVESGHYWEQRAEWNRALACYRKGLETDDLIEEFYQRSMRCYLALDRISEGMAAYRRCRQILSVVLGLRPEPRTEKMYASLKQARIQQQFA